MMTTMIDNASMSSDPGNASEQTEHPDYDFNPWTKYNEKFQIDLLIYYGPFQDHPLLSFGIPGCQFIFSFYTVIYQARHNKGHLFKWKKGKNSISFNLDINVLKSNLCNVIDK